MAKIQSLMERIQEQHPDLFNEIVEYLKNHTIKAAAIKYAPILQDDPQKLYFKMREWTPKLGLKNKGPIPLMDPKKNGGELSKEEEDWLQKFRTGEVSFEDAQRELAYRVFRRILEDPVQLKAADWLRSELVKIKREEMVMKKEQMDVAWAMIFGGYLLPKHCPKCGYDLQPKAFHKIQPLEVVEDAPLQSNDPQSMGIVRGI